MPGKRPAQRESFFHSSGVLATLALLPASRASWAINGRTLASKRLGELAYWTIFRN